MDKIAPAFEKPLITKNNQQKSIRIECRCKGKQEPKITWKKDKTELKDTPNKYKISKVKEADDVYLFILEILVRILFCFCLREREKKKLFIFRVSAKAIVEFIKFLRKMMLAIRKL